MAENPILIKKKLLEALSEDIGYGDITTNTLIPRDAMCEAAVIAEEQGVIAGIEEVSLLLKEFNIEVIPKLSDGEEVKSAGTEVISLKGLMRNILTCERTTLNLLMRMSGVATVTKRISQKIKKINPRIRIAATRKTMPLLNYFDKKAVALGGGDTHRFRLDDCILIKDNHLAFFENLTDAIDKAAKNNSFSKKIELEVETLNDALLAAEHGKVDIIMLDNMPPREIYETIESLKSKGLRDKVLLEASGGITEENVEEYAKTGVDIISMGSLTHSVKALNMKLEIKRRF